MTEAKGLNIVLTKEAVDSFLTPDKIGMYRFILVDNTYLAEPFADAVDIKDGKFIITGFVRIPENKLYTIECESNDNQPLKQSKY
ncbi:hypothetical protein [Pedobacter antarcticus]|uniref:hypothetical protein n=1 Tax=Pedobacter antarcticus TaxID=34086 RepID=UPI00088F28A5|nr:hypothetical protein [Pedobacter antarcticus]SDL86078.1 hypothetical protein SAMN04488084_102703 [Pedobacter antarcticus]